MVLNRQWAKGWRGAWASGLSVVVLAGCGGAPVATVGNVTLEGGAAPSQEGMAPEAGEPTAPGSADSGAAANLGTTVPTATPQLVKRATLGLTVVDMEAALQAVNQVLATHQGDLLALSDGEGGSQPNREIQRQVYLELRVPAVALEQVLTDLKALGELESQSLTAEDVSSQLVDLGARVRNLQRSEEALLAIMTRSGSVGDILAVSQELSAVRETIERTEAQRQALQGQVQFSTITLTLQTQGPGATPAIATTLGETWRHATHSVGGLSVTLLQLALWLLAYSPYWGSVLLAFWGYRRWGRWAATGLGRSHRSPTPSGEYTDE